MIHGRDTWIEVDLDAIMHNIKEFRRYLPQRTRVMAVVKADGYGHGAVPVARAALEAGASHLAVAFVDEGVELRQAGIDAPILVLGYTPPHAVGYALRNGLTLTVYRSEILEAVEQEAVRLGVTARVHVKVDTGMGRLGVLPEEVSPRLAQVEGLDHVEVEGIFTHYATADEEEDDYARFQLQRFTDVVNQVRKRHNIPLVHIANSAGAIQLPEGAFDMVRIGISMYGFYPSAEVKRDTVNLRQALSLKCRVAHVKKPPRGTGVSYGKTYTVSGQEWIAVLPVGYADGINRHLSNAGHVLVKGKRVPIVGRICMDQLMIQVTDVMPVQVGDEVVIYGQQGGERITVDEVASFLKTISYEVVCALSHRLPRFYIKNGEIVDFINRLQYNPPRQWDNQLDKDEQF
jgi:alanine racemase